MKKLSYPYPGRGIVIGIDDTNEYFVQIYWIMGRSENSRNRVLKRDDSGKVWTEAADPKKVKDPSLIIYTAMEEKDGLYVVSNGCQTSAVFEKYPYPLVVKSSCFRETMFQFSYEPDKPNFTPRISSVFLLRNKPRAEMVILAKSNRNSDCNRHFYSFDEFKPGTGYCITTYKGPDQNPLPAFEGPPYKVRLKGNIYEVRDSFWDSLNAENRISIAVKFISLREGNSIIKIYNKYRQA